MSISPTDMFSVQKKSGAPNDHAARVAKNKVPEPLRWLQATFSNTVLV